MFDWIFNYRSIEVIELERKLKNQMLYGSDTNPNHRRNPTRSRKRSGSHRQRARIQQLQDEIENAKHKCKYHTCSK